MNTYCTEATAVKIYYMEILCTTSKERNIKGVEQSCHSPKSHWTDWL